jgi:hypothetical protein
MLGLVRSAAPQWARQAGLDVWNYPSERNSLRECIEEAARIRDDGEALRASIETVDHITTRLIRGDLSLSSATDQVEPLMRDRRGFATAAQFHYVAPSFHKSVALFLVDRVRRALRSDPSQLTAIESRLESEYASMR